MDGSSLSAAAYHTIHEAVNDACDTGSLCFEYSNQGLTMQYSIALFYKKMVVRPNCLRGSFLVTSFNRAVRQRPCRLLFSVLATIRIPAI